MFNRDTVTIYDLDTYKIELESIFESFTRYQKKYLDLRRYLKINKSDDDKLQKLNQLYEDMLNKVVNNEVAVKKRLLELKEISSHDKNIKSDKMKSKIELKVDHAVSKFRDLVLKLKAHNPKAYLSDMSDELKYELRLYRSIKYAIDLEINSVDYLQYLKVGFDSNYEDLVNVATTMVFDTDQSDVNEHGLDNSDIKSLEQISQLKLNNMVAIIYLQEGPPDSEQSFSSSTSHAHSSNVCVSTADINFSLQVDTTGPKHGDLNYAGKVTDIGELNSDKLQNQIQILHEKSDKIDSMKEKCSDVLTPQITTTNDNLIMTHGHLETIERITCFVVETNVEMEPVPPDLEPDHTTVPLFQDLSNMQEIKPTIVKVWYMLLPYGGCRTIELQEVAIINKGVLIIGVN